jgi:hypothetical protein
MQHPLFAGVTLIVTLFILLLSQIGRIGVDYWITVWTENRINETSWQNSDVNYIGEKTARFFWAFDRLCI